jgi:hypothetical protein
MRYHSQRTLVSVGLLVAGLLLLGSSNGESPAAQAGRDGTEGLGPSSSRSAPSGTRVDVALGGDITSATANARDAWRGAR